MLQHDQERLENIHNGEIPPKVSALVKMIQKIRNAHIQTGHLSGDLVLVATILVELFPDLKLPENEPAKSTLDDIDLDDTQEYSPEEIEYSAPIDPDPDPVNWYSIKHGTSVICTTSSGQVRGKFKGAFKSGSDKGKLRVVLPDSENEFDVFTDKSVAIDPDRPAPE